MQAERKYLAQVLSGQRVLIVPGGDQFQAMSGTVLRIGQVVGQRLPPEDPAEKQDTRVVVVMLLEKGSLLIGQRSVVRFCADGEGSHKN